jgi:hypothetical protein
MINALNMLVGTFEYQKLHTWEVVEREDFDWILLDEVMDLWRVVLKAIMSV